MSSEVGDNLESDSLSGVNAWQRVHIADTSISPFLPGTNIGLLAMTDSMRTGEKIRW